MFRWRIKYSERAIAEIIAIDEMPIQIQRGIHVPL